jgi:hypothetical protein
MSIELVVLSIIMALYLGFKAGEAWYLLTFKTLLKELNVTNEHLMKIARDKGIDLAESEPTEDEHSDLPILEVRIEQHPEGLFAYRKADDSFIAQGRDRQGLMENLVNNLVNVRVVIAKEDGADLITP